MPASQAYPDRPDWMDCLEVRAATDYQGCRDEKEMRVCLAETETPEHPEKMEKTDCRDFQELRESQESRAYPAGKETGDCQASISYS